MRTVKTHPQKDEAQTSPEGVQGEHHHRKNEKENTDQRGKSGGLSIQANILVCLAMVAFLYFAQSVILPILLAVVLSMVISPFVDWLVKVHIPRFLGAALIMGIFFGGIGFGFVELSQPAVKWMKDAPEHLSELKQRASKFLPADKIQQSIQALNQAAPASLTNKVQTTLAQTNQSTNHVESAPVAPKAPAQNLSSPGTPPPASQQPFALAEHSGAGKALNWTAGALAGVLETVVLVYMLLVLGGEFFDQVLGGKDAHEKRKALTIAREIQETISKYLLTITVINICFGTLVGLGLYFCKVPNAALWGVIAALLNYIPYFGPIAGIIVVAIVGLLTFDSMPQSLMPAGWYFLLHLAEADYLTPVTLGKRFTVSPLVVFISLMFAVWLWGTVGALLAAPILICLKVLCQRLPALSAGNRFL